MTEYTDLIARRIEVFRKALMVAHAHDWDMDTVSEAAHVCARAEADALEALQAAFDRSTEDMIHELTRATVAEAQVEALQAERDAIDALHWHDTFVEACRECGIDWPCTTHRILHPGEPTQ